MDVLQGFTRYVSDIVDILIVGYLIYKLLIWLKGTRAVQLLKGISVVIVVWMISSFFELRTLRWLMENLFSVGVLVIFIIFQPELRRALEQLGRGRFFGRITQKEEQLITKMLSEIVKAVGHLSKRRIGALIVIERQTGLTDYIETGIELEAKPSSELLTNLFLPNTPLHDGAVIIRKGRIMAASCYLPLSENPFISKELGTRHRAGIGMSEVSDAISIIVSEETGNISMAIHGELKSGLTEEELLSHLFEELQPTKTAGFWIRRGEKDE